jgi:uroporphyrinogen decarboxylase
MKLSMWEEFKRMALSGSPDENRKIPVALIVDSPWLPGFMGISTLDYFLLPDEWIKANLYIEERFPDVLFLPGHWLEYGMATEPSAFGCKIKWWQNSPPSVLPAINNISEVSKLEVPNPEEDGLMPLILHLYSKFETLLQKQGSPTKMVAARGPLAIGAHLRGMTELMLDLKDSPKETKQFLEIMTQTTIRWLRAQIHHLSEVEGIMVLDDIVGFLSPADYMEFAHPYLQEIFSSFDGMVKVYHNDSKIGHILEPLAETGLHVLNFGYNLDMSQVWQRVGGKIRLMGNIPTLEGLMEGTPEEVRVYAAECIRKTEGGKGLILSAGGGAPPGVPAENIDALVEAARLASTEKQTTG